MMKIKKNIAVSESGFVFDAGTGETYSLNPVGVEIVKLMNEGKNQEEISNYFLSNYEVSQGIFESAYFDFVSILNQYNLIER
ncbi:MAG TPA: HPr-rel-A system PqqD family protein [Bacteroidales bacterium]|nr:HPr-rel-A system PqqD family protein [Bacteroidales bacterium]